MHQKRIWKTPENIGNLGMKNRLFLKNCASSEWFLWSYQTYTTQQIMFKAQKILQILAWKTVTNKLSTIKIVILQKVKNFSLRQPKNYRSKICIILMFFNEPMRGISCSSLKMYRFLSSSSSRHWNIVTIKISNLDKIGILKCHANLRKLVVLVWIQARNCSVHNYFHILFK